MIGVYVFQPFLPIRFSDFILPTLTLVLVALATAIVTMNPWWLLAMPIIGYGFAWVGHFFFEKNKPATFKYPLWSLMGDWRMFFEIVSGQRKF